MIPILEKWAGNNKLLVSGIEAVKFILMFIGIIDTPIGISPIKELIKEVLNLLADYAARTTTKIDDNVVNMLKVVFAGVGLYDIQATDDIKPAIDNTNAIHLG